MGATDKTQSNLVTYCIFVGALTIIISIGIFQFLIKEPLSDILAWIILVISTGIGIIITLIVDNRSTQSHKEVMKSEDKVQQINEKHREILEKLKTIANEKSRIALRIILLSLNGVVRNLRTIETYYTKEMNLASYRIIENEFSEMRSNVNLLSVTIQESALHLSKDQIEKIINIISEIQKNIRPPTMIELQTTALIKRPVLFLTTKDMDKKLTEIVNLCLEIVKSITDVPQD